MVDAARGRWRVRACRGVALVGIGLLPAVLALTFYFREPLRSGAGFLPVDGDVAFHVYQMTRAAELGGRWWRLAQDEPVGRPYPTGAAKLPQLYEGPDLQLASVLTSRLLSPNANYLCLMGLVLLVNGWVAGWLTWRLTRSWFWAAIAVVLITLNGSTAARMNGHLQLFKHGWFLLAVWSFSEYLDRPGVRRALALGLAAGLVLQGSYYAGFLMTVAFGVWWTGALLAGRLRRAHVLATAVAVGSFAAVAGLVAFPVLTEARGDPLGAHSFQRNCLDTWRYGAQLWQYVISPEWQVASWFRRAPGISPDSWEGWHYPGLTILIATAAYLVLRLRRIQLSPGHGRLLDRGFGLVAILVLLSLAGGPSAFLCRALPVFRSYGRAGLMAVGPWCVLAPAVLAGAIRGVRSRLARGALRVAVLALALYDGTRGARAFAPRWEAAEPRWVSWLAHQPAEVRPIVFPRPHGAYVDAWWSFQYMVLLDPAPPRDFDRGGLPALRQRSAPVRCRLRAAERAGPALRALARLPVVRLRPGVLVEPCLDLVALLARAAGDTRGVGGVPRRASPTGLSRDLPARSGGGDGGERRPGGGPSRQLGDRPAGDPTDGPPARSACACCGSTSTDGARAAGSRSSSSTTSAPPCRPSRYGRRPGRGGTPSASSTRRAA